MYTEKHFANCQFNPFTEKLFIKYPKLTTIVPDSEDDFVLQEEKTCKYIICMYDTKSPLIKEEQNLLRRKEVASEIAGFGKKDEKYLEELFSYKRDCFVVFITNYLKTFAKSMEWALISSLEETYWEYTERLRMPVTKGDKDKDLIGAIQTKTKLAEDAEKILSMYNSHISRFFGDEQEIVESAKKIIKFTNPEEVANV